MSVLGPSTIRNHATRKKSMAIKQMPKKKKFKSENWTSRKIQTVLNTHTYKKKGKNHRHLFCDNYSVRNSSNYIRVKLLLFIIIHSRSLYLHKNQHENPEGYCIIQGV